jgi:general secretion pathway protein K
MLSDLMTKDRIRNNRGIALFVTLAVITVLVAASLELHKRNRSAVLASAASRDRVTLVQMASSGIHIAMSMLVRDRMDSEIDSLQEDWANPRKRHELVSDFPFDEGSIEFDISDERSKIQLNALVALPGHEFNAAQFQLWDRLLGFLKKADESLAKLDHIAIINALKDWIDSGDDDAITGLTGAESPYYQSLDPPYPARNAPIDDPGDLFLIKGITKELLASPREEFNLLNYLSVYGATRTEDGKLTYDGKININTASLPVLAAILPEDYIEFAPAILDYRVEKSNDQYINPLSGLDWYKNVPGLEDLTIARELITNTSDIFRIVSTARLHGMEQTIAAVVQRETRKKSGKWGCRVLHWQTD